MRRIEKGDLVVATLAPRYEGYHGAVGRPFVLGEPADEIRKYMELVMFAQEETAKRLGPGMTAVEMDRISREHMEAAGFGKNFAYSAIHSVGVIEFEAPILSSKTDLVLSPGEVSQRQQRAAVGGGSGIRGPGPSPACPPGQEHDALRRAVLRCL